MRQLHLPLQQVMLAVAPTAWGLNKQGIYVIVTSGYDVLPMAARCAAAILQKPISAATLLSSLRPVVARKKSQKEQLTHG